MDSKLFESECGDNLKVEVDSVSFLGGKRCSDIDEMVLKVFDSDRKDLAFVTKAPRLETDVDMNSVYYDPDIGKKIMISSYTLRCSNTSKTEMFIIPLLKEWMVFDINECIDDIVAFFSRRNEKKRIFKIEEIVVFRKVFVISFWDKVSYDKTTFEINGHKYYRLKHDDFFKICFHTNSLENESIPNSFKISLVK